MRQRGDLEKSSLFLLLAFICGACFAQDISAQGASVRETCVLDFLAKPSVDCPEYPASVESKSDPDAHSLAVDTHRLAIETNSLAQATVVLARATVFLAICTGCGIAIGLVQLYFIARQDKTANASATTLLATNRPWLLPTITIKNLVLRSDHAHQVDVEFNTLNKGNAPAHRIRPIVKLYGNLDLVAFERDVEKIMTLGDGGILTGVLFPLESDTYYVQYAELLDPGNVRPQVWVFCGVQYEYAAEGGLRRRYSASLFSLTQRAAPLPPDLTGVDQKYAINRAARYIS
jgi:hypothetical protein